MNRLKAWINESVSILQVHSIWTALFAKQVKSAPYLFNSFLPSFIKKGPNMSTAQFVNGSPSKGTFIRTDLARQLKADGMKTTIKIKTLNGEDTQESEAFSGLKVSKSIGKPVWTGLPVTYAKTDKIKEWKYLEKIADEITQTENISIGILIGGNCSRAMELLEVIPGKNGGPYAFWTLLGWCIVGPVSAGGNDASVACNRVAVQDLTSKAIAPH